MRILIIEDEPKTAKYLSNGLTENGYAADIATNGEDGLFYATNHPYDLIILDVMLPTYDGWFLIKAIRRSYPNVRVLFLTARNNLEDRVKGLELGADDYLVKPFAFSELLARVRSLLRRTSNLQTENICIADLDINLIKHKVTRGSVSIELTPQEFLLLTYLAQHTGEVLSRTLIAEKVWDVNFISDTNVVDVAIRRLRQKIDAPFEYELIHTVRGIGYVLEKR